MNDKQYPFGVSDKMPDREKVDALINKHVPKYCIGIDPDLTASGLAVAFQGKIQSLHCLSFHELRNFMELNKPSIKKVYLEAGWLNKKVNFHINKNALSREKTAYHVGMNHCVGQLIEECLKVLEIPYILIQPYATKKNHEQFCRMTGWNPKVLTNQEKRDAGMLCHGHL